MALTDIASPLGLILFLAAAVPIAIWVAWSDMARMKIPNKAVIALFAVYVVLGPLALPLDAYLWGYANLAVVLAVGFVLNMAGVFGAGDAKFCAAAAPFVAVADLPVVVVLLAALLLAAFAVHRGARALPPVRRMVPHWESWARSDFPMGLALGPTLAGYLLMATLAI